MELRKTLDDANAEKLKFSTNIQSEEKIRSKQIRLANIDVEIERNQEILSTCREKMDEQIVVFNRLNDELAAQKRGVAGIEMRQSRAVQNVEALEKNLHEIIGG